MSNADQLDPILQRLNELQAQGNGFFDNILNALSDPYSFDEAKKDYQSLLEALDKLEDTLKQRSLNTLIETKEGDTVGKLYDEWQNEWQQMETEKKQFLRNAQAARKKIKEANK